MKAALVALGVICGSGMGLMALQIQSLGEDLNTLEQRLEAQAEPIEDSAAEKAASQRDERLAELERGLSELDTSIRNAWRDEKNEEGGAVSTDLAKRVDEHDDEIAALRKDLEGASRTSRALDETAERFLGTADGEGGRRRGGLADLIQAGELMRKPESELTDEERTKREELTSQMRSRTIDWSIRGFDRRLDVKLNHEQKTSLTSILDDESKAIADLRSQGLSREDRKAAEVNIKADSDARVSQILTEDQNTTWVERRSRSSRSIFGQR